MKSIQKHLSLLLALVMVFGLMSVGTWAGWQGNEYTVPATIKTVEELGDLTGKTVILHTNDVHGAIAGYAYIAALKTALEAKGAEVILVDAGDFSQGDPNVNLSKGVNAVELMNAAGYDVATLGNHEFDYGFEQIKANLKDAKFHVVCANILNADDDTPAFDGTYVLTTKTGLKLGFFGLDTPEAKTKTSPTLNAGMKVLDNANGKSDLDDCAKKQVAALKAAGVDFVIGVWHLGIDEESKKDGHRSVDVFEKLEGVDFVIDGHSHTIMTKTDKGEAIQSTGTKFDTIGVVVIDNASKKIESNCLIATKTYEEDGKTVASELPKDETVAAAAQKIIDDINAEMGEVFAKSEVELNGAKAPNGNRDSETNNGDLITEAMLWTVLKNPGSVTVPTENVIAITNGGGIRDYIKPGDVTKKDINTVLPFGNTVTVVYVSGAELLEALEASTFCVPEKIGGYPQTTGIKFTIDTTKAYDANAETYPNSTYYGPKSINRVTIESINGKDFDPKATYAVVTNNFCADGGDTYYAFKAASAQFDTGIPMDEAVMDYVETELGGVIGQKYAAPRGDQTIILDPLAAYTDVDATLWYAPAIRFVTTTGAMTGTGAGQFSPHTNITRAMVMKLIANMAGADTTPAEGEQWYDKAVAWAIENGISDGSNPSSPCERQDLAMMLYNYVCKQGGGFTGAWMFLLENPDASEIKDAADEAMHWMVMHKVLNGDEQGRLLPTGYATRAQMAQILLNFSKVELEKTEKAA